jgi:hypothetical protein
MNFEEFKIQYENTVKDFYDAYIMSKDSSIPHLFTQIKILAFTCANSQDSTFFDFAQKVDAEMPLIESLYLTVIENNT